MSVEQYLEEIGHAASEHGFDDIVVRTKGLQERIAYRKAHVLVLGEFNRGKTTLVNALIGTALLPMNIVPTTAAIWTVELGKTLGVSIERRDGTSQTIDTDSSSLDQLSTEGALADDTVRFVKVTTPNLALGENIVIVDTPGVNDINEQRSEITYRFLEAADAAIFIMDCSSPMTRSEFEFLERQVLSTSLDKLMIALNKSGRLDEDELEESIDLVRERTELFTDKDIDIVAIDARNILAALEQEDLEVANRWGWTEFKIAVDKLVFESNSAEALKLRAGQKAEQIRLELLERLDEQLKVLSLNEAEKKEATQALVLGVNNTKDSMQRFLEYIATHGRDRLKLMLEQSLEHSANEFVENQRHHINGMGPSIEIFIEKKLPSAIQLFAKRRLENLRVDIDNFVASFNQHIAQEYTKKFKHQLLVRSSGLDYDQGLNIAVTGKQASLHASYISQGLPVASMIAATFATGGATIIPILVASVAGKLLGDHIVKKKAAEKEDELSAKLPTMLRDVTSGVLQQINEGVDSWFADFSEAILAQFKADLAQVETKILALTNQADNKNDLKRDEIHAKINRLKGQTFTE
jgi:signal recognition particle receptor subunit beta